MADDFEVKVELSDDNAEAIKKALKSAEPNILFEIGQLGVEGAVNAISGRSSIEKAVDTGRLRASISFVTADGSSGKSGETAANSKQDDALSGKAAAKSVYIGTNVEYAADVHTGMWTSEKGGTNRKYKVRPFLTVGINDKREEMRVHTQEILEGKR